MPENDKTKSDSAKGDKNGNRTPHTWLRWIFVAGGIFFVALLFGSIFIPYLTERVKFFTANALSLSILVAIIVQAYIYRRQWEVMKSQVAAMEGQLIAMREGLTETRSLVTQNERAVAAAEQSAKIAREAFDVGEAPYFGIKRLVFDSFEVNDQLRVQVDFMNGGRTPAWNFSATLELILGDTPESGEHFPYSIDRHIDSTFIPSGEQASITFASPFRLDQDRHDDIVRRRRTRLFIVTTVRYIDRTGKQYSEMFCRVLDPDRVQLIDYDANR